MNNVKVYPLRSIYGIVLSIDLVWEHLIEMGAVLMNYQTQWLILGNVIHLSFLGVISGHEMQLALDEIYNLITESAQNEVHIIVNLTNFAQDSEIVDIAKIIRGTHPPNNLGWLVTVGEMSSVLTMAFSTAIQLMDKRMRQFLTIQEGVQFLQDMLIDAPWDEDLLNNIYTART